jgi:3-oxoacyl-[acyl-carrier protein] reductase
MQTEGSLVAISSIAGAVYGWEEHAHYAAAKAGVIGVCRSLAVELASRQIRCNAVVPGLIETPQSLDPVNSLGPEGLALAAEKVPLGRIGKAADVAELVNFLLGAQSAYITGQAIIIDGGITIRMPR